MRAWSAPPHATPAGRAPHHWWVARLLRVRDTQEDRPIAEVQRDRAAWPSYATVAAAAYVIYGIGAIAPYLRNDLGLSDAQVGLHSTMLAIGLIAAGLVAAELDRRMGQIATRRLAMVAIAVAIVALGTAAALGVTLLAAMLVGFGTGTMLAYANAELGGPGGQLARLRVARANVWAMVAAFVCPVALATAASVDAPWGLGLTPAVVLLLAVALALRSGQRLEPGHQPTTTGGRLPRAYWLAWTYLVAVIAIEFSIVFWAATLVERRTGVDTAAATLLGGSFLAGMFVGRLAQSRGLGTGGDLRRPAATGVLLAAIGAVIAWISTTPTLSGIGIFVAGLGVAGLYPLGVAAALGAAPGQLTLAGTRLTLASGTAVLVAPFALGVVADLAGVVAGWGLVVALAVVALALVFALPAGSGESRPVIAV